MASFAELAREHLSLGPAPTAHLQRLIRSWGLLADLSFSDVLLFAPTSADHDKLILLGHVRPTTAQTIYRTPDGQEFGFHGTYREISRPDRMVSTYVFEMFPDAEAVETLVLEERDGRTTVITTTVHKSMQNRDAHLANGAMEAGMNEGYARLDELLPQLRRAA